MKIARLEIKGADVQKKIILFIRKKCSGGYFFADENSFMGTVEDFTAVNTNTYTKTFISFYDAENKDPDHVYLHVIVGGAGAGWFNMDWGETSGEIQKTYRELVKYGEHQGFKITAFTTEKK